MTGLTKRQAQVVAFIKDFAANNHGSSPTYREIGEALGLSSMSSVYSIVAGLEARGVVWRRPGAHRGLELLTERRRPAIAELFEKMTPDSKERTLIFMLRELGIELGSAA